MVVVVLEKCPISLRGDLTKWLIEINVGVYVGQVSARVRDNLWARICEESKSGRATMAFSKKGEQKFDLRVHNASWEPIDFDGIKLMLRPSVARVQQHANGKVGYSNAAKQSFARYANKTRVNEPQEYVVVDVETTGLSPEDDSIIEIGAVKIVGGIEQDRFQTYVNPGMKLPDSAVRLTGITDKDLAKAPSFADVAEDYMDFVGFLPLVMHNAKFDVAFLDAAIEELGYELLDNEVIDTLDMARKRLPTLPSHRLGDLRDTLNLENRREHRALDDCMTTRDLFIKLIEM